MKKGLGQSNDEGMLWWYFHMERDMIAKRVYVGLCAVSHSLGRLWNRWIDTVKECLKKKVWMSGKQGEWWGFVKGNAWGIAQGMNP